MKRMPVIVSQTAAIAAALFTLAGCSYTHHDVSSTSTISVRDTMPSCPIENVQLGSPTAGLFIGVSDYQESARVWSTPAHAVSAAMFREPFVEASRLPRGGVVLNANYSRDTRSGIENSSLVVLGDMGERLITAKGDALVISNRTVRKQTLRAPAMHAAFDEKGAAVVLLEDGKLLVFDDGERMEEFAKFELSDPIACGQATFLDASNRRIVASGCGGETQILDSHGGSTTVAGRATAEWSPVAGAANRVALYRDNGQLVVTDLTNGADDLVLGYFGTIPDYVGLTPTGKFLLVKHAGRDKLSVYPAEPRREALNSFEYITQIDLHDGLKTVRFAKDGETVAIIAPNGAVTVWAGSQDLKTYRLRLRNRALDAVFVDQLQEIHVLDELWLTHVFSYRAPSYVSSRGKLALLADFSLAPDSQLAAATAYRMNRIGVRINDYDDFWDDARNDDGTWNYLGDGQPVGKTRIFAALEASLRDAEALVETEGSALFVFYMSAHGWIDRNGRHYILPADADYDDPSTWIRPESLYEPIAAFLNRSRDDGKRRVALVVFDSCQNDRREGGAAPQRPEFAESAHGYVIETTSPGQYAWHWTAHTQISGHKDVTSESRWGFPLPPPKAARGPIQVRMSANMSSLPLASKCFVSRYFDRQDIRDGDWLGPIGWMRGSRQFMLELLADIPEVSETGQAQDMQLFTGPVMWDTPLFVHQADYQEPASLEASKP